MRRHALVLGCTGQLGSYLCELLLEKDYRVFGLVRRTSTNSLNRIAHLSNSLELLHGDLTDQSSLECAVVASRPDEVYNCAAQTQVGLSYQEALHTADVTGLGPVRLWEAIRLHTSRSEHVRCYHPSTSEMFGESPPPQSETTAFHPLSPYAAAKVFAHHQATIYRRAYGLFIACGMNFNFESPRRGGGFVTRKITRAIGRILADEQDTLQLGDCTPRRDWSHAKDVARAAWLMLQQSEPEDYVIASGVSHTVQEFVEVAFNLAGLDYHQYVTHDPALLRPLEPRHLEGCAAKAKAQLGWETTYTFLDIVKEMLDADCRAADLDAVLGDSRGSA